MLDLLMTPLGRPPLDTYSPSQLVQTAEPMPAGIWEIEGGAIGGTLLTPAMQVFPVAGIRYGLTPNLELGAGFPGGLARNVVQLKYAPIPALWALNVGADLSWIKAGTTFEIALPWITPRLSVEGRAATTLVTQPNTASPVRTTATVVTAGAETRALRAVHLGADVAYTVGNNDPLVSVGARFRPLGNLGLATHVTTSISGALGFGAVAAARF